jgi:hypothetical protein
MPPDIFPTALGANTLASGLYSTAAGNNSFASGGASTALGYTTTASGDYSLASGFSTIASGNFSVAMGRSSVASGHQSVAIGTNISTNDKTGAFFFGDSDPNSRGLRPIGFNNQFAARFNGGYYFISGDASSDLGVMVLPGGNSWAAMSDINRKKIFYR